jgi:hypothetical protein
MMHRWSQESVYLLQMQSMSSQSPPLLLHLILPINGLSLFPSLLTLFGDRILIALGRKCLYISKTPEMIKFQHFYTQIQALPFGITFYGTRSFITFAAIFKVTSLIASALVFLLGWSASK